MPWLFKFRPTQNTLEMTGIFTHFEKTVRMPEDPAEDLGPSLVNSSVEFPSSQYLRFFCTKHLIALPLKSQKDGFHCKCITRGHKANSDLPSERVALQALLRKVIF